MEMLVKAEQPTNADLPIVVTELGMEMLFKPEQYEYLHLIVTQIFACKTVEKC